MMERAFSSSLKTEIIDKWFRPDPFRIAIFNPQGLIGRHSPKYMNYPGTTTMGGQITYQLGWSKGFLSENPCFHLHLVGQQVKDVSSNEFNNDFLSESEGCIVRYMLDKLEGRFIDKEDVNKSVNINNYLHRLEEFGRDYARNNPVPLILKCEYYDSVVSASFALDEWKQQGARLLPRLEFTPHSLGYRKLLGMLKENLEAKISNFRCRASKCEFKELLMKELDILMADPKYNFPFRIYVERLAGAVCHVKLNSKKEMHEQFLNAEAYTVPLDKLASITENYQRMKVIPPGLDLDLFQLTGDEEKIMEEMIAEQIFRVRTEQDIAIDRRHLPYIVAVGRLNRDKNFHGLARDFISDPLLAERANLLFVVNGPDPSLNVNYIAQMQRSLHFHSRKRILSGQTVFTSAEKGIHMDLFQGSALEQLVNMAEILQDSKAEGKWTCVSLPDRRDFAGLLRYLGRNSKAVSGLFSFEEPYGLAAFELSLCGIPVIVSANSGCTAELVRVQAESFDPKIKGEIARALLKTLDDLGDKNEIRKRQMEYALSKSWGQVTVKELDWMMPNCSDTLEKMRKVGKRIEKMELQEENMKMRSQKINKLRRKLEMRKKELEELVKGFGVQEEIPVLDPGNERIVQIGKEILEKSLIREFEKGTFNHIFTDINLY